MKLIAHRCGTDRYPELTVQAAQYSLSHGALYVEMDIRRTADGAFVICHDKTARRLFGDGRNISKLTLSEFLSLRHVSDPRYPAYALEDFLKDGIRNILFHVKEGGENLPALTELCGRYGILSDMVLGLQSPEDVTAVRKLCPGVKTLAFMPGVNGIEEFAAAGAEYIRLWEDWVSPTAVQRVKDTGRAFWVMAGQKALTGYADKAHLFLWEQMGADAVLVNEVEKTRAVLGYA